MLISRIYASQPQTRVKWLTAWEVQTRKDKKYTVRVVQHWKKLPREPVDSVCGRYKTQLDKAIPDPISCW